MSGHTSWRHLLQFLVQGATDSVLRKLPCFVYKLFLNLSLILDISLYAVFRTQLLHASKGYTCMTGVRVLPRPFGIVVHGATDSISRTAVMGKPSLLWSVQIFLSATISSIARSSTLKTWPKVLPSPIWEIFPKALMQRASSLKAKNSSGMAMDSVLMGRGLETLGSRGTGEV